MNKNISEKWHLFIFLIWHTSLKTCHIVYMSCIENVMLRNYIVIINVIICYALNDDFNKEVFFLKNINPEKNWTSFKWSAKFIIQ